MRLIRSHLKSFNPRRLAEELSALPIKVSAEWRGFERVSGVRVDPLRKLVLRKAVEGQPLEEIFGEAGELGIVSEIALGAASVIQLDAILDAHDFTMKSRSELEAEKDAVELEEIDAKWQDGLENLTPAQRLIVMNKVVRLVLRSRGKQE